MTDQIVDLKISTKKGLHRPLRIEIDGKFYTSTPIVKSVFDKMAKLQEAGEGGDTDAPYEQIKLIFGVPKKILYDMDMRDISVISDLVTNTLMKSENYRTETEKKTDGPGEKNSV